MIVSARPVEVKSVIMTFEMTVTSLALEHQEGLDGKDGVVSSQDTYGKPYSSRSLEGRKKIVSNYIYKLLSQLCFLL